MWRAGARFYILSPVSPGEATQKPRSRLKSRLFVAFVFVLVVSVLLRMLFVDTHSLKPNPLPSGAKSFASNVASEHPRESSALATVLPYVTEASLFGLIGFALGFTSRKVFKLALILLALAFVTLQVLVSMGRLEVDWNQMIRAIDGWILNMNFDSTVPEFLKRRLPTMAMFALGYVLGLRKG